jgi:hypothetical protein
MIDTNLLSGGREPRQLARHVGAHRVFRRTSPTTLMEDRMVSLTPRAIMRFGSLGFVYTGPVESIVKRTFARPAHPNALTAAAGRHSSGASRTRRSWPCWVLTQRRSVLGLRLTTTPTSPFRSAETSRSPGLSSWSGTPPCTLVDSQASQTTR